LIGKLYDQTFLNYQKNDIESMISHVEFIANLDAKNNYSFLMLVV